MLNKVKLNKLNEVNNEFYSNLKDADYCTF